MKKTKSFGPNGLMLPSFLFDCFSVRKSSTQSIQYYKIPVPTSSPRVWDLPENVRYAHLCLNDHDKMTLITTSQGVQKNPDTYQHIVPKSTFLFLFWYQKQKKTPEFEAFI